MISHLVLPIVFYIFSRLLPFLLCLLVSSYCLFLPCLLSSLPIVLFALPISFTLAYPACCPLSTIYCISPVALLTSNSTFTCITLSANLTLLIHIINIKINLEDSINVPYFFQQLCLTLLLPWTCFPKSSSRIVHMYVVEVPKYIVQ